ncbi:MAG: hypothetical protein IT244_12495 [Bacteroidia bacterium]|nr:hypothetical protein [Bacteroidia bacterium]
MGKLKSFLKIEGTIGEVTFVKVNGQIVARTKGGISGDVIKNDARFERTRENMAEFADITQASKLLREAANALSRNAKDGRLHSRLTSLLAQIKNADLISIRGMRKVALGIANPGIAALLKGFEMNAFSGIGNILAAPYTLDTVTGTIAVPSLDPKSDLQYPPGATHVRFVGGWLRVDFGTKQWEAIYSVPNVVGLSAAPAALNLPVVGALTLPNGTDFYLLKIEFGQEINGQYYPLKNGQYNGLTVLEAI